MVLATRDGDRWMIKRCHIGLRVLGLDVVVSKPLARPAEAAAAFAALVESMRVADFDAAQEARRRLALLGVTVAIVAPKTERGRS